MKLTVRQAADMLAVPEAQVYRWVDDDEIPFIMIQQQPRFHRLELLEWAIEMEIPIKVDLYEGTDSEPLSIALERGAGGVVSDLRSLASSLPVSEADRALVAEILAARELAAFVEREGIAIPRARSPLICAGSPSILAHRACEPPIGASRVRTIFAIVAPTIREHLQLLSRLSLALHDAAFVAASRAGSQAALAAARTWERARRGGAS